MIPSGTPTHRWSALDDAMLRLKKQAPDGFDDFVKAFATHIEDVTDTVTLATPDRILVCQGHLQEARKIHKMLTDVYRRLEVERLQAMQQKPQTP